MILLFIKLLLAHLLGDFLLQPDAWVASKEKKKIKSGKFYLHLAVHTGLSLLFLAHWRYWYVILLVVLSHGFIDLLKLYLQKKHNRRFWFFTDQTLHLLSIFLITLLYGYHHQILSRKDLTLPDVFWVYGTGLFFLSFPCAFAIKTALAYYTPKTEIKKDESLHKAGLYIGMLDRILVFLFVITQHWEGIGFLLAAKSIFRFSDLTKAKDRKLTEYILIGTLLSYGIAILMGLLCNFLAFQL